MKKVPFLVIAAVIALVAIAVLLILTFKKPQVGNNAQNNTTESKQPQPQGRTFIMSIDEQNGSKQQGTAQVTELDGGKVKVVLSLAGGINYNETQPAHIHVGKCPKPGEIKYRLNNLLAGASETIIDVSMDAILTQGALAINVHESDKKMSSYIACGNIPEIQ
jgi:hypothetical protein